MRKRTRSPTRRRGDEVWQRRSLRSCPSRRGPPGRGGSLTDLDQAQASRSRPGDQSPSSPRSSGLSIGSRLKPSSHSLRGDLLTSATRTSRPARPPVLAFGCGPRPTGSPRHFSTPDLSSDRDPIPLRGFRLGTRIEKPERLLLLVNTQRQVYGAKVVTMVGQDA